MAKLVDALPSGGSVRKDVQVRILFWAPKWTNRKMVSFVHFGFYGNLFLNFILMKGNVADGEFILIGNPYASPVDFNKLTATNLTRRFYVWDPHLNLVGAYVVMEDLLGTGTYTGTPNNSGGQPNNFIQSSEAFFVQKSNIGIAASLSFNEPNKSNSNNLNMFRPMIPKNQVQSLRTNLYELHNDRTTKIVDGNLAEFSDDFHAEIDLQDALKFGNVNETLGILNGTTSLAVNRRPPLNKDDTIFYKFTRARH